MRPCYSGAVSPPLKRSDLGTGAQHRPPHIGIFWAYRSRLIVFSEPVADVSAVAGVKDSRFGHDAVWAEVVRSRPELGGREYYDVPRGRVVYRVDDDLYNVFLPRRMHLVPIWLARICRTFALPSPRVRMRADLHYERV